MALQISIAINCHRFFVCELLFLTKSLFPLQFFKIGNPFIDNLFSIRAIV